jgi:ribosome-binding factor A
MFQKQFQNLELFTIESSFRGNINSMNVNYKITKIGIYWFVAITTDLSSEIYFLVFMKGKKFMLLNDSSSSIVSEEKDYKKRISSELYNKMKLDIFSNNNYITFQTEENIDNTLAPDSLINELLKYIRKVCKN